MSIENYEEEVGKLKALISETIRELGARAAEAERERDRYRAALEQYASDGLWQVRDVDGELCEWIGGGEGPDLAEKALAGAKEGEAK